MLTAADLSENRIILMQDLKHHPYLECLNVSRNLIEEIGGLASLRFLRVLNLSYNRLSKLSNLEGVTTITDLNVEGNAIESLDGLNTLSRLRSLNLSHNRIQDLEPLSTMTSLQTISLSGNQLHDFRQLKHLKPLANLTSLDLDGNAFSADRFYRLRCMFSLPQLLSLDKTNASPEEKVRLEYYHIFFRSQITSMFAQLQAQNLYRTEAGELGLRRAAHMEYLPSEPFIDYSSQYLSAE